MLWLLIPEEEKENIISRRKLIRGLILLKSFKRIKREITSKKISPLISVTIVQQRKKSISGRITKDIMLI